MHTTWQSHERSPSAEENMVCVCNMLFAVWVPVEFVQIKTLKHFVIQWYICSIFWVNIPPYMSFHHQWLLLRLLHNTTAMITGQEKSEKCEKTYWSMTKPYFYFSSSHWVAWSWSLLYLSFTVWCMSQPVVCDCIYRVVQYLLSPTFLLLHEKTYRFWITIVDIIITNHRFEINISAHDGCFWVAFAHWIYATSKYEFSPHSFWAQNSNYPPLLLHVIIELEMFLEPCQNEPGKWHVQISRAAIGLGTNFYDKLF